MARIRENTGPKTQESLSKFDTSSPPILKEKSIPLARAALFKENVLESDKNHRVWSYSSEISSANSKVKQFVFDTIFKDDETQEIGHFVDEALQGPGNRILPDGREEIGLFDHGALLKGQRLLTDGRIEEGTFHNEKLTGSGDMLYPDGVTRDIGQFESGVLHGEGERYLYGQLLEKGTFAEGKLQGQGYRLLEDGTRQAGLFNQGKYVE